ncbi:enoyl-CoA hydratase/isomerase family protein [Rhodococcus sp. NPDC059968]|uniref:enoyl-CoA hydratase/isomerase family protein n=1 Tax=Rhodococcus sp. NPDC059968 TaxID=3347017 RepID=UPI0036723333
MSELVVQCDDDIMTLTLNRPLDGNRITPELASDLGGALRSAPRRGVRCIILAGEGDSLCEGDSHGLDVSAGSEAAARELGAWLRTVTDPLVDLMHTIDVPTVTAVKGPVLGIGLALTLASTVTIADPQAVLGTGQWPSGVVGHGIPFLLGSIPPAERAAMLILDRKMTAARARELGLICDLAPAGHLDAVVRGVALEIASRTPAATGVLLRAVRDAHNLTRKDSFRYGSYLAESAVVS